MNAPLLFLAGFGQPGYAPNTQRQVVWGAIELASAAYFGWQAWKGRPVTLQTNALWVLAALGAASAATNLLAARRGTLPPGESHLPVKPEEVARSVWYQSADKVLSELGV